MGLVRSCLCFTITMFRSKFEPSWSLKERKNSSTLALKQLIFGQYLWQLYRCIREQYTILYANQYTQCTVIVCNTTGSSFVLVVNILWKHTYYYTLVQHKSSSLDLEAPLLWQYRQYFEKNTELLLNRTTQQARTSPVWRQELIDGFIIEVSHTFQQFCWS